MGGDVRTTVGVPKLSAFANGSGTPIVIDTLTGQGYFTEKNAVLPLVDRSGAEPTSFNVACTPEVGAFGPGALGYVVEQVVGNLVNLTLGWDIPDVGTGSGAVILGYNATARGLTPADGRFWAIGAGRKSDGAMLQVVFTNGYLAVFTYANTNACATGYLNRGSLTFMTSGK